MDNVITKKRIAHKLSYDWMKFLGVLVIIIIFWTGLFMSIFRIKPNEEIILFTSAYNIDREKESEMKEYLSEYGVRKVTYTIYPAEEQNYSAVLLLKGLGDADLLILRKTDLESLDCARYFVPIDESLMNKYAQGQEWDFYNKNDTNYGIMIYQKDNDSYNDKLCFDDWLQFSQEDTSDDYYLLINVASKNIGEYSLNTKNDKNSETALRAFGFLLDKYREL